MAAQRDSHGRFIKGSGGGGGVRVTTVDRSADFGRLVHKKVQSSLLKLGFRIERDMKINVSGPGSPSPVTGRMLGSIKTEQRPMKVIIGSTIAPRAGQGQSYPFYQEIGTSKNRRAPWARPALDSNVEQLKRDLKINA